MKQRRKIRPSILALSLVLAAAIFTLDVSLSVGVTIAVVYLAPVAVSVFNRKPSLTLIISGFVTVLSILGFLLSPVGVTSWIGVVNRALAIAVIWLVTFCSLARIKMETTILESEERYALAIHGAKDGLWVWDIEEGSMYYSPRWKQIIGWKDPLVGSSPDEWFNRVHPDDKDRLMDEIHAHLKRRSNHFEREHRLLHKDGSYRWVLSRGLATWNELGRAVCVAGSLTDITVRKRAEESFRRRAIHDPLTGVFSRRHFMERLQLEIRSARRYGYPVSLCLCDIDHFKHVNDTFGHRVGDRVLARFGRLMKNLLRTENIVGRYGGDEFCIVFPHTDAQNASISLERLRSHFEKVVFEMEDRGTFSLTATFGVADLSPEEKNGKNLLELADRALYYAKNKGRNRIMVVKTDDAMWEFDPSWKMDQPVS